MKSISNKSFDLCSQGTVGTYKHMVSICLSSSSHVINLLSHLRDILLQLNPLIPRDNDPVEFNSTSQTFLLLFVFIRPDSTLDMNCSAMDSSINVGVGATVHAGCCGRREFYCQNSQSKGFKRIRTREKKKHQWSCGCSPDEPRRLLLVLPCYFFHVLFLHVA